MRSANSGVPFCRKARVKPNQPEAMGFGRKAPQFNVREAAIHQGRKPVLDSLHETFAKRVHANLPSSSHRFCCHGIHWLPCQTHPHPNKQHTSWWRIAYILFLHLVPCLLLRVLDLMYLAPFIYQHRLPSLSSARVFVVRCRSV